MKEKMATYKIYLEEQELSETTVRTYLRYAKQFVAFLDGCPVTKRMVLRFRDELAAHGYKITTINLAIIAVNRFLQYLKKNNCRIKTLKYQRRQSMENIITEEEYHRLLSCARENGDTKYYAIMKTLALTGIRISELRCITIQALEQGYTQVQNKGKTREIYLSDSLIILLKEYCRKENITEDAVFRGRKGKAIGREAVWKQLKIIAGQAGVKREKVYPHSFRHFFAQNYMRHFPNISELADILGHSSLETTRIYLTESIEQRRKKLEKLNI